MTGRGLVSERLDAGRWCFAGPTLQRHLLWPALVALLAVTLFVSLSCGRYDVPLGHVAEILLSPLTSNLPAVGSSETLVVRDVRLPRVLMASLAGTGLALCGGVLQGIFRNPLVGPQTIGVASGAALGGVVAIMLFGFGMEVQPGAFAGAALALLAVIALHRADSISPILTLVLAGVVVSAFCGAVVGFVTFIADPETKLPGIVFWLLGSFAAASWPRVALIGLCTLLGGTVLLGMRWRINALSLGDEEARLLGLRPARDRLLLLGAVCLIVSAQVAVSGTIGWIGLVVPNFSRMLVGADHRRLLPAAALIGATFMTIADTLARDVTAAEIPVGVITAIVGAPIFGFLLRRTTASTS
jgi:iron complex transport system permease protein